MQYPQRDATDGHDSWGYRRLSPCAGQLEARGSNARRRGVVKTGNKRLKYVSASLAGLPRAKRHRRLQVFRTLWCPPASGSSRRDFGSHLAHAVVEALLFAALSYLPNACGRACATPLVARCNLVSSCRETWSMILGWAQSTMPSIVSAPGR